MKAPQQFCADRIIARSNRAAAGACKNLYAAWTNADAVLVEVEEWESREQFERHLDSAKLNTIVAASRTFERGRGSRWTKLNVRKAVDTWH